MSFKQDPNDPTKLVPNVITLPPTDQYPKTSWAPIFHAVSATDGTDYTECRSVWIGNGGSVIFTMASGDTAVFSNIDDGTLLPFRVTKWAVSSGSPSNVVFLY